MTPAEQSRRRRAHRLLRCYPREWRSRYGEEFHALLLDDMEEQPRSLRRTADVVQNGLVARLATTGLVGRCLDPERAGTRTLVTLGTSSWVFVVVAVAVWAQLTIGWQWSEPDTAGTTSGMVVMTAAVVLLALVCVACAVPVAWVAVRALVRDGARRLRLPLLVAVAASAILVVGTRHFANGWPGTGGHVWAHQGIVPGGVAAGAWASTLFVTSYWLHPSALGHFPGAEVAWMLVSPAALVAAVWAAMTTVTRIDLSPRLLELERRAAVLVALAMGLFILGASLWIVDGGPGPRNLFHAGALDVVELFVLALLVVVAARAAGRSSGLRARQA